MRNSTQRSLSTAPSPALRLLASAALLCATLPAAGTAAADAPVVPIQLAQAAPAPAAPAASPTPAAPTKPAPAPALPDEAQRRTDNRRAYVDAGIAALHAGLLLTPAQQSLWPPVETALRDYAATRGMHGRREGREEGEYEMQDPVARLKQRGARLTARGQAMTKLADAAAPLYAALSPEQKERVPRLLTRMMPRRMERGGMGRYGMDRDRMGERGMGERGIGERGMGERFSERGDDRGMGGRMREGYRSGEGGGERP